MISEKQLLYEARKRICTAQKALGMDSTEPSLDDQSDLKDLESSGDPRFGPLALAVIRDFAPVAFALSSLRFAQCVPEEWRNRWFGAFTRTAFLAGNPENLRERIPFHYVSEDRSFAWLGPASPQVSLTLRRLLVTFPGTAPPVLDSHYTFQVPVHDSEACSRRCDSRTIVLSTDGLTQSDYLVNLNHALTESLHLGLIEGGAHVTIRHVPFLDRSLTPFAWVRVHRDKLSPSRLRAYCAVLSSEARGP